MTLVLVHSPFLGPASLRPLGRHLGAVVPDLRPAMTAAPVQAGILATFRRQVAAGSGPDAPTVLVGHSGSGPLLPGLAAALPGVTALVFLDAGLPTPGRSWRDTVPAALADELLHRARGDRLPPWSTWFDPDPLPGLVRDPALRAAIADEQPEVPVAFLGEPRPDADWAGPAGYVRLSAPYEAAAAEAAARGWPVRRLDAHHLAGADDPAPVAAAVVEVLGLLAG